MQKIQELLPDHSTSILEIINDAANAYKGAIPDDRWKEPYMSANELADEIRAGVRFHGWFEDGFLVGIAGFKMSAASGSISGGSVRFPMLFNLDILCFHPCRCCFSLNACTSLAERSLSPLIASCDTALAGSITFLFIDLTRSAVSSYQ